MQPTRRQVLLGGLLATAACTSERPAAPRPPSQDDRLRAEAVAREQALVDAYLAAMHEHPALTGALAPLLGDHAAHLAALQPAAGTPTPTATASPTPHARPRPRGAVVAALVAQERSAAAAHAEAAALAEGGDACGRRLAPLLASLAAAEASHAVSL